MIFDEHIKVRPLVARCNPVLPVVYDDTLSYYELLCKLTHKLNEVIAIINAGGSGGGTPIEITYDEITKTLKINTGVLQGGEENA